MPTIYTIGHSTRSLDEFVEALRSFEVRRVADVRTVPRSRHNPQFGQELLPDSLDERDIDYSRCTGGAQLDRAAHPLARRLPAAHSEPARGRRGRENHLPAATRL